MMRSSCGASQTCSRYQRFHGHNQPMKGGLVNQRRLQGRLEESFQGRILQAPMARKVDVLCPAAGTEAAAEVSASVNGTASSSAQERATDNTALLSPPPPADAAVEADYFGSQELVSELSDPKAFGKNGEAWFFAQAAVILLIIFPPIPLQGLVDFLGVLALTAGSVFLLYALLSLGRNISPLPKPRKNHTLVTSGMYSYVRHPMYGGLVLVALGLAAVTRSETRLALAGLLWFILEQKMGFEERELAARYPQYEEYKAKVKKFIPFFY